MKFELTILGSNSATPAFGRNQSSQLLNVNEKYYLIDCGEGTQLQLNRFGVKKNKINYIFISHLHGDHYLGIVGLLSSMHLSGRTDDLHLYAPPELKEIIDLQFLYSQTLLRFPLHFHATDPIGEQIIYENDHLIVRSFPLDHRIPCTGFRFDERQPLPRINKDMLEALSIPPENLPLIKQGQSFQASDGTIYRAEELTLPPKASRSYAYCSDTKYSEQYFASIQGVDLLYHEATFLNDMADRAAETYHTTALQAAEIAKAVSARRLLIGHFSARYRSLAPLLEESRSVFSDTILASEGAKHSVEYKD